MATIDEDDEFEDAFEEIPPKVLKPVTPKPENTPRRPKDLNVADRSRNTPLAKSTSSQSHYFASPSVSHSTGSAFASPAVTGRESGAHRDRLLALRRRMNVEFGGREASGGSSVLGSEGDDALSTLSEATSLHSWHRHMLSGPETMVVHASDSVSTCATSHPARFTPQPNRIPFSPDPPSTESEQRLTSPWGSTVKNNDMNITRNSLSPIDRSPAQAPPPLPSRRNIPTPNRVPPPLPPRSSNMRLPDPVSLELAHRMKILEDEKENSTSTPISSPLELPASVSQCNRVSTKSNDSVGTICEAQNGEENRKKGHSKSNSLDRGLTLAKSLKSGPFPPTASKSNSLKRQEAEGEEEKRNNDAEVVIRELTTTLAATSQNTDRKLEPISSGASSSISSPSNNSSEKQQSAQCESSSRLQKFESPLDDAWKTKAHATFPSTTKDHSDSFSSMRYSLMKPARETEKEGRSMSDNNLNKHVRNKLSTSFDPIAQDVERRLSMKREAAAADDRTSISLSDDDAHSRYSMARSSIDHAKSLARNSVMYASGFFRGALKKVRNVTHTGGSAREEIGDETSEGEQSEDGVAPAVGTIVRPRKTKKGPFDFEQLTIEQELDNEHTGAVWCVRFSVCGRLLATAGQDSILRIWVIKSHLKYFSEMREKYHANMESSVDDPMSPLDNIDAFRPPSSLESVVNNDSPTDSDDASKLFVSKPFAVLKGHTADILDMSWSKNYFILSSGMDRTVKLWHISRSECLCCFQHIDFVTCVAFLPKDDRYFLSGSLDGKLRLWHIPDKKVAVWNEVQVKFITAITFVKNGKFAVVGTYNGRCYFYTTDQLKYHTVVDVRSSRGRNAKGHKVTGLAVHGDKLLVTSNDSRIRMYDVRDKALTCKFRGVQNEHSQIRAAFSPDGRHIVCGSEDKFVYLWRTSDLPSTMSVRKDRNSLWERVRAHNSPVSVAIFAPRPQVFFDIMDRFDKKSGREVSETEKNDGSVLTGQVIVSADLNGCIKVMVNRPRQTKTGQSTFFSSSSS